MRSRTVPICSWPFPRRIRGVHLPCCALSVQPSPQNSLSGHASYDTFRVPPIPCHCKTLCITLQMAQDVKSTQHGQQRTHPGANKSVQVCAAKAEDTEVKHNPVLGASYPREVHG